MKKRIVSLMLAGVMTMGLLAGCGNTEGENQDPPKENEETPNQEEPNEEEPTDEIVEIDFYIPMGTVAEQDRVMDKANEIIEKEIGAHLNIIATASDYQAIQLMIDTGDDWDMCFTSNWLGDYFGNAQNGAYADLTELLPELAPETYSRIPESLWDGMKVDGKIYGFVNYQQYGSAKNIGLRFRKDIAEEVGFDWKSIQGMDILEAMKKIEEEYLAPAFAAHPDMIGWEAQAGSNFYGQGACAQLFNCEYVGDASQSSIGWINFDDPTKVFNQYETEEFMEYCKLMRSWYEKGYIPADAATVTNTTPDRQSARYLFEVELGVPDSIEFDRPMGMSMCTVDNAPAVSVSMCGEARMPAGAGPTAAVAVSADSDNIEKCVELMELLNTNDDLFNLIVNGEEGVDYTYDEAGNVVPDKTKYFTNYSDYMIAQSFDEDCNRALFAKNEDGELAKEAQKYAHEIDKTALISPLSGFVFNTDPVKTEMANVKAVVDEMFLSITTGSVDPEEMVPQFLDRLEQAGASKIVAEKQAQLDAYLASK